MGVEAIAVIEQQFGVADVQANAAALDTIGAIGLFAMGIFLLVLIVGFVYEWKKGALEWD